jgi:hypothetical protein
MKVVMDAMSSHSRFVVENSKPFMNYIKKGQKDGAEPHGLGLNYVRRHDDGSLGLDFINSLYKCNKLISEDQAYAAHHPEIQNTYAKAKKGTHVDVFPVSQTGAPNTLRFNQASVGGPEPIRKLRECVITNTLLKRDCPPCIRHGSQLNSSTSCGFHLKKGDHVFLHGEDIHLVKNETWYVGAWLVDINDIDILPKLNCKVGVVKVAIHQLCHFVNRLGVVTRHDTTDGNDDPSKSFQGYARVKFIDGSVIVDTSRSD